MKNKKNYYLGLDIGTNSVGYAVTNPLYEVLEFKGQAMWGSHVFESGEQAADRGVHRSSRRRLARKKQRIELARELFANEVAKVDKNFFIRQDQSALLKRDKSLSSSNSLFNDENYQDNNYYKEFPTIHHLIMHLINSKKKPDIRFVYLAISYLLTHRGHFLIEVDKDDIESVVSFDTVYQSFLDYFDEYEIESHWSEDIKVDLSKYLKEKVGIRVKSQNIKKLILGKRKKLNKQEEKIIACICGGVIKLSDLFMNKEYEELEYNRISLSMDDLDERLLEISNELEEQELELIIKLKTLYDWSLLSDILKEKNFLSEGKITTYNQHKEDLKFLKIFVKRYLPTKYKEVFYYSKKKLHNYVAYSKNFSSAVNNNKEKLAYFTTNNEEFCKYIKKLFKDVQVSKEDESIFTEFKTRLDLHHEFMPKQINTDNGVIPYQINRYQLKSILGNVSSHYPFLLEKDEDGLSIIDKLISIIEFRIPYYVGPLNDYHGKFSWIIRKAKGKILPWNLEEKVNLEKTENAFIRKMTGKCSYLAGEEVLYKNSLLYSKYTVLNEINNIKIDEEPITIECKQHLYEELFVNRKQRVTKKRIGKWLISNNYMLNEQEVRGIDDDIKSTLNSYHKFKRLLKHKILNTYEVEDIIGKISIISDKRRLKKYLKENYSQLSDNDLSFISKINFRDYGRLSEKLLTAVEAVIPETGEITNIIGALWETNLNLMQLLSNEFNFNKEIRKHNDNYYKVNPQSINSMLEDMYISNAVKRPIFRTIDIVKEIKSIMKQDPKKIFIEMSRRADNSNRPKSRKDSLTELYKNIKKEMGDDYFKELEVQLHNESSNRLRSKRIFLYYLQLGKCMYTGEEIDLSLIYDNTYDIDHIYPQSKVKDDSIHNNLVLVNSSANRKKEDKIPISSDVQKKMKGFWDILKQRGLLNKEKYFRLTRNAPFSDEELVTFINRQIVETRQSTKAVASILRRIFPETEIVYVKASIINEFRNEFNMLKSREVNDLHHAKDAYLNIVMGNVFHVKFTSNPLNFVRRNQKYSIKIKAKDGLLSQQIERNGEIAWLANHESLKVVKQTMDKNNINYVRYSFMRKGGFFNQNPDKATEKNSLLIPRKKNLPVKDYGGYNGTTASFFTLVKHKEKGKSIISIRPVELVFADKFINDEKYALEYCKERLELEEPEFLSERRILKVNTLLYLDGFRATISAKINQGRTIVLSSNISLIVGKKEERYIKRLEAVVNKSKHNNINLKIREEFDKISLKENLQLYMVLNEKCNKRIFDKMSAFKKAGQTIGKGLDNFKSLSIEEQVYTLLNMVYLFKTGRSIGCNLSKIGGSKESARVTMNSKITSAGFKTIKIIDQSSTGLFEKYSRNLLEL